MSTTRATCPPPACFLLGDAMALPVRDAGWDVAISGLTLNFLPDPATAVARMARAVRPGGLRDRLRDAFDAAVPRRADGSIALTARARGGVPACGSGSCPEEHRRGRLPGQRIRRKKGESTASSMIKI
ncbi:class I SAM-dependent methyltransferase [Streptomyces sp. NPDC088760]|uniref:class I SAM-dependent methyltransferase n=1 Tax=Streptomyces sp. NPDC088760 TaxID=3365890 RepID=UPI0038150F8F